MPLPPRTPQPAPNPTAMKKILLLLCLTLPAIAHSLPPQDSIRELLRRDPSLLGGSSALYRPAVQRQTPPPEGFEPFHIEHLGRHGSRLHISPTLAVRMRDLLDSIGQAGALRPKGERLLADLRILCRKMYRRYGDLSELGREQQRGIARRMFANFSEVFTGDATVTAFSTVVPRSSASMGAFAEQLKGCNPRLRISLNTSCAYDPFLRFNLGEEFRSYLKSSAWRTDYEAYAASLLDAARLLRSLMTEPAAAALGEPRTFMIELFSLAVSLPNGGFDFSFYDYFTEEELFALWRVANLREYLLKMNSAPGRGLPLIMAKPLADHMLRSAQAAVDGASDCAVLRFGHGEATMPLSAILEIEGLEVQEPDPAKVYLAWQDFNGNPMAANIQWILYRNAQGRILVKVLFNEREAALPLGHPGPYYDWDAFRSYYEAKLAGMPDLKPLPEVEAGY